MFTSNPFSELSASIPAIVMQAYVILMILAVIAGTILDMIVKKNAQYFFENAKKAERNAKRSVSTGEKAGIATQVVLKEVLTSGEFCNTRRRLSHLLTMYGFIIFVVTTAILIFGYATPGASAPGLSFFWHLGALMLAVGGYWFWFFIRVDVSAEGLPWNRLERADLFIVSLLATSTFGLLWSFTQSQGILGWIFFALFVVSATTLFCGVFWSKFAHMFFKPAAAFEKRVTRADGSRENLPADYDLTDPAVQARFPDIPEYMGKNPPYMGLGIKRSTPNNY